MSEAWLAGIRSNVGSYFQALREAARYIYSCGKSLRLAYERVMAPKVLPQPVRSVLFLCRGNICRSPLAEVYFVAKVRKEGYAIAVKSAGIETTVGKPAHARAREVALQNGISLERHTTTPLFQDLIHQADLVFVMEVAQKDRVARLYPQSKRKVFVLGQFCTGGALDIDDPYSGTQEDFRVCFERIRESCDQVLQLIGKTHNVPLAAADSAQESSVQVG